MKIKIIIFFLLIINLSFSQQKKIINNESTTFQLTSRDENIDFIVFDTKLETKISEDLYKIVDTLEKRIECFNKRCQFTPANDEIACEIGNHLQNLIENNKMQINKIEIENKINKIKSEISANLNAMADFIIANSDDYHRMISAYCEVSEKKRKVIEMFKNAREFYLKKQFEKAIEVFKEILTIDPNDGPSAKYIAYIQKLKKDDLPEDWNGAWHAE